MSFVNCVNRCASEADRVEWRREMLFQEVERLDRLCSLGSLRVILCVGTYRSLYCGRAVAQWPRCPSLKHLKIKYLSGVCFPCRSMNAARMTYPRCFHWPLLSAQIRNSTLYRRPNAENEDEITRYD